ncbi:MAG: lamin tail domain-containing protein, partial [Planctomycetota bacterium]
AGRANLETGDFLVIFCDENILEAVCELHATFRISSDGSEPLTLWGPEDGDGERPIIDQVWLPPLRRNVSFGRFPDGAGPAPVPVDETFDHFGYHPLESDSPPTFGECIRSPQQTELCGSVGGFNRSCGGAPNTEGVFVQEPRIRRFSQTTNRPAPGEAVTITVRVRDDLAPTPENIDAVEIRYRVNGGDVQSVTASYEDPPGLDNGGDDIPPRPLDQWTLWTGTIPPQPDGALVEFHYYVRDKTGFSSTRPRVLCENLQEGLTGPCDREFGGPPGVDCPRDTTDVTCRPDGPGDDDDDDDDDDDNLVNGGAGGGAVVGERFIECDAWFRYVAGYTPPAQYSGLVINEVVPSQDGLLEDPTQDDCMVSDSCQPTDDNCCPDDDRNCCKKTEDYIELYNAGDEQISLAGLWLSDAYFQPYGWQFPEGSKIDPGEHLIVWLDNDGGKCPDPVRADPPCFWECPDVTDPDVQSYHTNFSINLAADQIYIIDSNPDRPGVIHGVEYSRSRSILPVELNQSISLVPDGQRSGCFVVTESTPREPNSGECKTVGPEFLRGDAQISCAVDLADAVFTLNFLFLGGPEPSCLDAADANDSGVVDIADAVSILGFLFLGSPPPALPGPDDLGPDPTDDELAECVYKGCP